MKDTHFQVEEIQMELLRKATVADRFQLVNALSQQVLFLAKQGIQKSLNKSRVDEEVEYQFMVFHYGEELAQKVRRYKQKRNRVIKKTQLRKLFAAVKYL